MRLRRSPSTIVVSLALAFFCLVLRFVPTAHAQTITTLTITSGGSPVATVVDGTVVTLTATVTAAGAPVKPGQVNFCDATAPRCTDMHLLGTAQLTAAGTAILKFVPGVGTHSYRAAFLGTTGKAASSSTAKPLTVTATYSTTTAITAGGTPGNYTLTATVTGTSGILPPTGIVSFLDTSNTNYILQTAPLAPATTTSGLSFLNSSSPATNPYPQSVGVADFNGDGKLDMAVAVYSMFSPLSSINVLLGNGDGTFTPAPVVPLFNLNAGSIAIADFNGDGKPDIIVTLPDALSPGSSTLNEMQVMLGNGDGTFTVGQNIAIADPFFVTTGDFNGDGIVDLAVAIPATSSVKILLGNGDGTFTLKSTATANVAPLSIAVADFNNDGKSDLAAVNYGSDSVVVLLGNGDGTFQPQSGNSLAVGGSPESIAAGDFNEDGNVDLAVANSVVNTGRPGTLTILLGHGDGTFTPAPASPPTGNLPYTVTVADFNADGVDDLVTANVGSNNVSVLLGNGDGTFSVAATPQAGVDPLFATVGDFNGDGLPDIAAADNYPVSAVTVLLTQSGTATATAAVGGISPVGTGTHLVEASYPGDATYRPSISATTGLTAQRVPTTLTLTTNPTSSTLGQQVVLTASLVPNNSQNHNASGTITFMNGSTVVGTGTVANGIATLNITSLPGGTASLTASYPGDTNFLPSASTPVAINVGGGNFTISLASPSLTIQTQHHLTTTITLTSSNGFTDSLTLNCASLPTYVTCAFTPQPALLAANGATTVQLTIDTSSIPGFTRIQPALRPGPPTRSPIDLALLLFPASLFAGFATLRPKSRRRLHLLLVLTLPGALALSGCGTILLPALPASAAPGIYAIPITATATSTGLAHTANLTLTITP